MKTTKFLRAALILVGILLSACATPSNAAPVNGGGGKALSDIAFTGVIESMEGDQWVINGQTVKVDSTVLQDGPFVVGDKVKVEAAVSGDGSVTAQRVEAPSADAFIGMSTGTPVSPSATETPVFDDNGNEAVGTVDDITDTSVTIGGQTYAFDPGVEIKGEIAAGDVVKIHFTVNADGTLSVREIEIADQTQMRDDSGNNENSDHGNVTDDSSNDDNHNGNSNSDDDEDNGKGSSNNDDEGGNSNGNND